MEKEEKPLTTRQLTTLKRRKHIVETAAACFVEDGFHQTSMRDIAKRAGTSLGNLYNHFESKTAMIEEIAGLEADDLEEIRQMLSTDTPPKQVWSSFVNAYFDYVSRPENAVLTAEITAEAMRNPQIVAAFTENRKEMTQAVATLLDKLETSYPVATEELAVILLNLIDTTAASVAFDTANAKQSARTTLVSVIARIID